MATTLAVTVIPAAAVPQSVTLYDVEDRLSSLIESVDVVTPEQEGEFLEDLRAAMVAAVAKRDAVGHFMTHVESQMVLATSEIARLRDRKARYESAFERMEEYVSKVIRSLGVDAKGKWKKLEGNVTTFGLRGTGPVVNIKNEAEVPPEFKRLTIKINAGVWEQVLDSLPEEFRAQVIAGAKLVECEVSKTEVKKALQANNLVPGADLTLNNTTLVRS